VIARLKRTLRSLWQLRFEAALRRAVACVLVVGGLVVLVSGESAGAAAPAAGVDHGELVYTTFVPPAVYERSYRVGGGRIALGPARVVARLGGADGVAFAPDGSLVVAEGAIGRVVRVVDGRVVASSPTLGSAGAYHLAIDPTERILYTSGEPGPLEALALPELVPVSSPAQATGSAFEVTQLAFGPSITLATSSTASGTGSVLEVDLRHWRATTLLQDVAGAHGIAYDSWSRGFDLVGGDQMLQISASDPSVVRSERSVPGAHFDQVSADGHGLVFAASNTGSLVVIDEAATGRLGDLRDPVMQVELAAHLDDVAPLSGPGAVPRASNGTGLELLGGAVLAAGLALEATDLRRAATVVRNRSSRFARGVRVTQGLRLGGRRLPRWDLRRRERLAKGRTTQPRHRVMNEGRR
jgi:hypothetical protein